MRRLISPVLLLCCLIPIGLAVGMMLRYGINVPMWDEWDIALEVAVRTRTGTLQLSDLWMQRNEHRAPLLLTVTALSVMLTDWNLRLQLLLNGAAAFGIWLILLALLRPQAGTRWQLGALMLALLVFSLRQGVNWQMSTQLVWFTSVLFTVAALRIVQRETGWRALSAAMVCAVLASFSTTQGLAVWGAIPLALMLRGERRLSRYGVWTAAALVTFVLYFSGYDQSQVGVDVNAESVGLVRDPALLAQYILIYLGGPFLPYAATVESAGLAFLLGAAGLALLAANVFAHRGEPQRLAPWLALAAFAVAVGLLIGLGRAAVLDNIVWQPMVDRYTLYSTLFWIALLAIALPARPIPLTLIRINRGAAGVLLLGYLISVTHAALRPPYITQSMADCIVRYVEQRNIACYTRLFVDDIPLPQVQRGIERLAVTRLSTFTEASTPDYAFLLALFGQGLTLIGPQVRTEYTIYSLPSEQLALVLFQHPDSRAEVTLSLPTNAARVLFRSAVWVDTANLAATDSPQPQDGALFRLNIRDASGTEQPLWESIVDPHISSDTQPVSVDLTPYRGQTIILILITEGRQNRYYDWALWVDPVVIGYR